MDDKFNDNELLLRAVFPENQRPDFWINGHISSAALKDSRGLSVSRTYDRSLKESVDWMTKHFRGAIVSITVKACNVVNAYVKFCPSFNNPYHSEIHGSKETIELSNEQALELARSASLEFMPDLQWSL